MCRALAAIARGTFRTVFHRLAQVDDRVSDIGDDLVVFRQQTLQMVYLLLQYRKLALESKEEGAM